MPIPELSLSLDDLARLQEWFKTTPRTQEDLDLFIKIHNAHGRMITAPRT